MTEHEWILFIIEARGTSATYGVAVTDQVEIEKMERFINPCDYLRITAKWTKQKFNIDKKQEMDFLGRTRLAAWRAFCRSGFWI